MSDDASRDDRRRRDDLRAFLKRARQRVDLAHAGLIGYGRRRVTGLRREEVAELAQLSVTWYTRFETGKAQLSLGAIERIADALQLSYDDRHELARLARPDVDRFTRPHLRESLGAAAEIARRLWAATSTCEVIEIATRALYDVVEPGDQVWGCVMAPNSLTYTAVAGPSSEYLEGYREHQHHPGWDAAARARISVCPDLDCIETDEMRERVARMNVHSYVAAQLPRGAYCTAGFGIASWRRGVPDRATRDAIDLLQRLATAALRDDVDPGDGWRLGESPTDELLIEAAAS